MKREIKFRAWDTQRKMFVPQGEIIFRDYGDTSIEVYPNDLSYVGDSVHNGEPQRGRFIVSQYTGLKDKAGKEIYELHEINNNFRVVYKFNRYILQHISKSDIFEEIIENGQYEITGEYSPLEEN